MSDGPRDSTIVPLDASSLDSSRTVPGAEQQSVRVRDLRCSYGSVEAVKGIDLDIAQGEIFALLGPNGAGKTTTIEILEGFRKRSAGEVHVLGVDPEHGGAEWRSRVGVVLQNSRPEPELAVRECVALYGGYYERPREIDDTIALVGLEHLAATRCEHLSGGEQRRLDVALALVGDPELLFLDEPTTGFDPAARRAAWTLILNLRELGKTIVLTTHYMEEAERLADRIAVIAKGRLIATGTPQTLAARELMDAEITFTLPTEVDVSGLPAGLDAFVIAGGGQARVSVRSADPVEDLASLTRWAMERDCKLPDLEVRRPTLEDVYLDLTRAADLESP